MSTNRSLLVGLLASGLIVASCKPAAEEGGNTKPQEMMSTAGQRPEQPRPDPAAAYSVPIEGAPFTGAQNAKVTIVEAFEFACPFSKRARQTLAQLEKDYGNDLKIVRKHYLVHPGPAMLPALAACAGHLQGKFVQMEEGLWEKAHNPSGDVPPEKIDEIAKEVGLDMDKFKADINGECAGRVQKDQAELAAVGVRATPSFFINGRFLFGSQPIENFKAIIDEELKKANDALSKGMKVENYYHEAIVKNGKKGV